MAEGRSEEHRQEMENRCDAPSGLRGNSYKKVEDWTDIFDTYQVDLVLQGHNHEYSRSYPLRGGKKFQKVRFPKMLNEVQSML